MKRKGLSWVLAVGLLFTNTSSLYAAATPTPITIIIDGVTQNYAIPPQTIDNSTYLPFRAVCESLGATVEFDQPTATATITYHSTTITHKIGTNFLFINDTPKSYTTQSLPNDGNTLAPIRMIAEALNATVLHDPTTNTATITTQQGLTPPAPTNPISPSQPTTTPDTPTTQPTPAPIRTNPNKTAIFLDDTTVVYLEDILTSIGSQEVHTNQEIVFSEADILVPLQQLADAYSPFSDAVSETTLYTAAKSYIEAYYNVDYTTTTLDNWYSQIQPYFDDTFWFTTPADPNTRRNTKDLLSNALVAIQRQQLKMQSYFISDPSLVYTVSPTLANLDNNGKTTETHFPWAVRGTLFYKFDSLDTSVTSGRFWTPSDGETGNGQWWQADVEIRFGINENATPYKAVTRIDRVFWISEHATPVQN